MKQLIQLGIAVLGSILSLPPLVSAGQILYVAQQPSPGATNQVTITELGASGSVGTLATFNAPSSTTGTDVSFMAFDSAGNLFVNDYAGATIKEITPQGSVSTFSNVGTGMGGVAFDAHGILYAARGNGDILKFASDGSYSVYASFSIDGARVAAAGLAFDPSGNLFAAIRFHNSIFEVKPDGSVSTFATFASGTVAYPFGLVFNSAGDLFVGDQGYGILKVTPNGMVSTFATIPDYYPSTLVFGQDGNLYTANYNSILKLTPDGTVSTFATGLNSASGLAVQAVPEPSNLVSACVSVLFALWGLKRRRGALKRALDGGRKDPEKGRA